MVKGSGVMQIVFSMKGREEIMAIQYCMLELVFFKVLSHTDTVHDVAKDASESASSRYPGVDEVVAGSPQTPFTCTIMYSQGSPRPYKASITVIWI